MQDLTRRRLLAAAVAGAVAGLGSGCTGSHEVATTPVIGPDHGPLAAALARERALLTAYADAMASFPQLAAELGALGGQHQQHLEALLEHAGTSPTPGSSATLKPTAQPSSSAQHPDSSARAKAMRRRLADLERATGQQHGDAAVSASRVLAPLLASLAACEASHALVLSKS